MEIKKRNVLTFSPSTRCDMCAGENATSSLYKGVRVTKDGTLPTAQGRSSCGSVNDSRKKRRTSRASGDAGSAAGFAVVRVTKTCSIAVFPALVPSAFAQWFNTCAALSHFVKSTRPRIQPTTFRSDSATCLPASSSNSRSSAKTSTITVSIPVSAAPAAETCSGTRSCVGSAAAARSAVNATMARPRSATKVSAATACLLTTAHAIKLNATERDSVTLSFAVGGARPSTATNRNVNESAVCAKTAGNIEYVMLTFLDAPALENTGAESMAGNRR
mmetsp:Transcript_3729/g.12563  ORF Transcript_3729/g.12563 Transcript_3729/m.12563 type:complete len:275 (+) Transcript_3729:2411-3235(+)